MAKNRTEAQKQAEALEALRLHNQGLTTRQIAEKMSQDGMSISQATVVRRMEYALALYVIPGLDDAKKEALARYDTLLEALSVGIRKGDVAAIKAAAGIQAQRDKILGLDKPATQGNQAPAVVPSVLGLLGKPDLKAVN